MSTRYWYKQLDQLVARLADTVGVRITRARPVDCTETENYPVAAYYIANGRPVVFNAPLERLRGLGANAFACHRASNHPYVLTLLDYQNGRQTDYPGSILEKFHLACQPRNAAEYLGVRPSDHKQRLNELPPEMAVLPWLKECPKEWLQYVKASVLKDQKQWSGGDPIQLSDWNYFGPMSAAAGVREWRRLMSLYAAMDRDGYKRSPRREGDITGQLLLDDRETGDWCFCIIGGGQHRAGVAGALGYASVPVRLTASRTPLVVRSHVSHWPQVRSGLFTEASALQVFDRVLAGSQPFPWQSAGDEAESGSVGEGY